MGVVVFLLVSWLVAGVILNGLRTAHRQRVSAVAGLASRVSAMAAPMRRRSVHVAGSATQEQSDAEPTLADLELPAPPEAPSAEGRLVAALLAGSVSPDRYRRAMHVLAAREDRAHPEFPFPPIAI